MLWLTLSLSPLTVTRSGGNDVILAKPFWQIIQLPLQFAQMVANPSNIWSLLVNFIEQIIYWKVLKCVCVKWTIYTHTIDGMLPPTSHQNGRCSIIWSCPFDRIFVFLLQYLSRKETLFTAQSHFLCYYWKFLAVCSTIYFLRVYR